LSERGACRAEASGKEVCARDTFFVGHAFGCCNLGRQHYASTLSVKIVSELDVSGQGLPWQALSVRGCSGVAIEAKLSTSVFTHGVR